MRGKVVRAQIRLDLDQAAPQHLSISVAHQDLVQEVAADVPRFPLEERGAEDDSVRTRWF